MVTTEQTRAAWDTLAAGYDEHMTTKNLALAEAALRLVDVRPGMRVLDVATGSGALAIPAVRQGAEVVAVDISPAMIERLEARAKSEGLERLSARVMDAHALDLVDASFDLAASQLGIMIVPDFPRALREMARVTTPGGKVLIVAFGAPEGVEFLSFFLEAMRRAIPGFTGFPADAPPLPFQVARPDVLRRHMADAGLREIRIEPHDYQMDVESVGQLWDAVIHSHPIGAGLVAGLDAGQRQSVQDNLSALIDERAEGGVARLHNNVNIATGVK